MILVKLQLSTNDRVMNDELRIQNFINQLLK